MKWLGIAALVGVIVQGLLGGFRVVLHVWFGTNLAVIHGCFAQVVFSLFVSLAVHHLGAIRRLRPLPAEDSPRVRLWSLLLTVLVFLQLIWGALVRHTNGALAQRFHFLTAFAVVAAAVWLAHVVLTKSAGSRSAGPYFDRAGRSARVCRSCSASRVGWASSPASCCRRLHKPTIGQAIVRVSHVLIGSFILAASVVLTVKAHRPVPAAECEAMFDVRLY